jgi:hypothetical protein
MTSYRITKWSPDDPPEILETREIDAGNAGEACRLLGWKLFRCSYLIVSDIDRWNAAKERIRVAYQRVPMIAKISWGTPGFERMARKAFRMNDIELIESLSLDTEQMADEMGYLGNKALDFNFEEILTDTSLLLAFAMWRDLFGKCYYCGQKGETIEWHVPEWRKDFLRTLPHHNVCLVNPSCWQKALDEGLTVISESRHPYVEALVKQGKNRQQMQEFLRVSRAIIDKDMRILKARGNIWHGSKDLKKWT